MANDSDYDMEDSFVVDDSEPLSYISSDDDSDRVIQYSDDDDEDNVRLPAQFRQRLSFGDAFRYWLQFMVTGSLDAAEAEALARKPDFAQGIATIQSSIETRIGSCHSSVWSADLLRHLDTYPTLHRLPLTALEARGKVACGICGRDRQNTDALELGGIPYVMPRWTLSRRKNQQVRRDEVPPRRLMGPLCCQRVRCYHALRHAERHVLVQIKARLAVVAERLRTSSKPKLLHAVLDDRTWVAARLADLEKTMSHADECGVSSRAFGISMAGLANRTPEQQSSLDMAAREMKSLRGESCRHVGK